MTKMSPPISCYLSAEGCYEVEHGLFLQCKKLANTMDSFISLKSKIKSDDKKDKKINKYLISSDESDNDITPSKKLKS